MIYASCINRIFALLTCATTMSTFLCFEDRESDSLRDRESKKVSLTARAAESTANKVLGTNVPGL